MFGVHTHLWLGVEVKRHSLSTLNNEPVFNDGTNEPFVSFWAGGLFYIF